MILIALVDFCRLFFVVIHGGSQKNLIATDAVESKTGQSAYHQRRSFQAKRTSAQKCCNFVGLPFRSVSRRFSILRTNFVAVRLLDIFVEILFLMKI